ncbi:hypothetical protein SAMN05444156_0897 [Verrucomicrobium sp. GAS474]|uniref:hypothetical protein n=1 Tax=Verrucomicrobium sp. GAS474 TaxID=1882831 RepID=UPI00087A7559|nr:hypothetical protein [Verrucomicrobium sp. GAS474]SDT93742.1 hypothetical protein SAMN05444156_0897 [Verrucomicrobium sp. GAS474]
MKTLSNTMAVLLLGGMIAMTSAISALAGVSEKTQAAEKTFDDGWEIAAALDVHGKGGWTTCGVFAKDLQHRFTLAGGESHIVVYDWTDAAGFGQRHALFVYRDTTGRYWGIDNRHAQPKWLAGTTPAAWVDFWEPDKKSIHLVADVSNPKLAGRSADKSRYDRLSAETMVASNK